MLYIEFMSIDLLYRPTPLTGCATAGQRGGTHVKSFSSETRCKVEYDANFLPAYLIIAPIGSLVIKLRPY